MGQRNFSLPDDLTYPESEYRTLVRNRSLADLMRLYIGDKSTRDVAIGSKMSQATVARCLQNKAPPPEFVERLSHYFRLEGEAKQEFYAAALYSRAAGKQDVNDYVAGLRKDRDELEHKLLEVATKAIRALNRIVVIDKIQERQRIAEPLIQALDSILEKHGV